MGEADRGLYIILALSYIDSTLRKSRFLENFTYLHGVFSSRTLDTIL